MNRWTLVGVALVAACSSNSLPPCDAPPTVLVSDPSIYGLQVAADGSDVYYTQVGAAGIGNGDGQLWRLPAAGGVPVEVWHAQIGLFGRGMAADDRNVYWPGDGPGMTLGIYGVQKSDGKLVLHQGIDGTGMAVGVEQDDDSLYATTLQGVVRLPKSGGAPTVLATVAEPLLAVGAGFVFFPDFATRTLNRVSTRGGAIEKLADLPAGPKAIAFYDPTVLVSDNSTVFAIPKGGGAPRPLAPPFTDPVEALAADASGVYAGVFPPQAGAPGSIIKLSYDGSTPPRKLADVAVIGSLGAIALDGSNVYWATRGEIGRVGKCAR